MILLSFTMQTITMADTALNPPAPSNLIRKPGHRHPVWAFMAALSLSMAGLLPAADKRPNIVLILADDMGYSDVGCYGSEIPTPNIDRLAREGVRFSQFYNTSRCCPTRASLLTGLYQHQAGMGMMMTEGEAQFDFGVDGYRGHLNRNCVTIAGVLRAAGYHTYMTGKWHLGGETELDDRPLQRGFEKFYGSLSGAFSYFKPQGQRHLTMGNDPLPPPDPKSYYTTDAFTDQALEFIDGDKDGAPFFLYLAYNAPHWPLHAKPDDIAKFDGKYLAGWDELRAQRFQRQVQLGLFPESQGFAPRDAQVRAWKDIPENERKDAAYRMSVYAAQVYAMDYNIGKLLAHLERTGKLDSTLVIFLSDNGACAEPYSEFGGGKISDINNPDNSGSVSYGRGWANLSNTPFREYKNRPQEGGISAPLIMRWPQGITASLNGTIRREVGHIIDILPTLVEVTGAGYPTIQGGELIHPMEGHSLTPFFSPGTRSQPEYLFFEHSYNCAVRSGDWKAVARYAEFKWTLYNLATDRLELHDVAGEHPEIVARLSAAWRAWALRVKAAPKGIRAPGSYN